MIELGTSFEAFVQDKPVCAGLLVAAGPRRLLFTLSRARDWSAADGKLHVPVRWVGGGQEQGEGIVDCARREAHEELAGGVVTLRDAHSVSWFADNEPVSAPDLRFGIRPLVVATYRRDDAPYRPGLPGGPLVYVALYLATCSVPPTPGDVPGLLALSRPDIEALHEGLPLGQALRRGIKLWTKEPLPPETVLVLERRGPETLLRRPELFEPAVGRGPVAIRELSGRDG